MPSFGQRSLDELASCHCDLQALMKEAIKHGPDFSVLEGFRDEAEQERLFRKGLTTIHWPYGNHNKKPSLAVDIAPYFAQKKVKINWKDTKPWHVLAGYVKGIASQMGFVIRWGGDWDSDWIYDDQNFHDLPHLELKLTEKVPPQA